MPTTATPWPPGVGDEPAVHPTYARLLCAELQRRGHAPDEVLAGTGLGWAELQVGQRFLTRAQLHAVVTRATALCPERTLGLLAGLGTELSAHGALGMAGMSCDTVAQALPLLLRFSRLRQHLVHFELQVVDEHLALSLTELRPDPAVSAYVLGHLTGAVLRLMQSITGRDWRADVALDWPFDEPAADAAAWLPRTRFGAAAWRLLLPPALLAAPGLAPDPQAHQRALRDCEQLLAQLDRGDLVRRLRQRLVDELLHPPSLPALALEEHVSPRTLIRRLADDGTSYQELLDEARAEHACWLLSHSRLSVEAVAEQLGYVDTSNFSRTFKRWRGVTPRAFRQGGSDAD